MRYSLLYLQRKKMTNFFLILILNKRKKRFFIDYALKSLKTT